MSRAICHLYLSCVLIKAQVRQRAFVLFRLDHVSSATIRMPKFTAMRREHGWHDDEEIHLGVLTWDRMVAFYDNG
jgi:hypothetical protein